MSVYIEINLFLNHILIGGYDCYNDFVFLNYGIVWSICLLSDSSFWCQVSHWNWEINKIVTKCCQIMAMPALQYCIVAEFEQTAICHHSHLTSFVLDNKCED
jgi:hypothetical protein